VQVSVLAGEPRTAEHMARHPFGKMPLLDHDGVRILETSAITRYLNDVLPGKSLVPATPRDRARMDMVISLIDSYGYGALVGGVAAYHLFPDFVGGKNDAMHAAGLDNGKKAIALAMRTRGASPFIAGDLSLADLHLAPIAFYCR
jgi:glutathione S-transferase